MKRREFLKSATALAAGTAISAPAIFSAEAQSRKETLLLVTENGPNNLDIHGVGTNRPGYEASWNCYDRLITHGKKTLADGSISYDRDKFVPELAEDMNIGDMSVTFKLKKNAKFQDGTPVTAKDVKWSYDRAVSVGGFPTVQMKAGSLIKKEQFVAVDDSTFRVDYEKKNPPHCSRSRGDRARHLQLGALEEERHRKRSVGARIHQEQHRRQRRLQGDELEARRRNRLRAQ